MLDHTRRILLVLGIFLATGWLYKQWREDWGGAGLFKPVDGGSSKSAGRGTGKGKLSVSDVPNLALLSEEYAQLAAAVLPSVVSINTRDLGNVPVPNVFNLPLVRQALVPGLGSGVIVSNEGHIVTNFHVLKNVALINGVTQLEVVTYDGKKHSTQIIGADEQLDVAILKIEGKEAYPALSFGNSDETRTGQIVFAIGIPFGLNSTVTQGIISATQRRFTDMTNDLLQTDTVINPGNSGGPLVNILGEIVGINVAIYPGDPNVHSWQGVGLAIPANDVRDAYEAITTQGSPQGGYLGISLEEHPVSVTVTSNPGTALKGAVISSVAPNSPAAQAGLKKGDVVIEFDGRRFEESYQLMRQIRRTRVGETKAFDIVRNERKMDVKITFGPRPKAS